MYFNRVSLGTLKIPKAAKENIAHKLYLDPESTPKTAITASDSSHSMLLSHN